MKPRPLLEVRLGRFLPLQVALLLLLLPLRLLWGLAVNIAVHELFHILALHLLGAELLSLRLGVLGARIHATPLTPARELLCALAGPFGGICVMLLGRWMPAAAFCAAFHTAWNLLPVYPSDGGRALRCALKLLLPTLWAERLACWVQWVVLAGLLCLGWCCTFRLNMGILPLGTAAAMVWREIRLANRAPAGYNIPIPNDEVRL